MNHTQLHYNNTILKALAIFFTLESFLLYFFNNSSHASSVWKEIFFFLMSVLCSNKTKEKVHGFISVGLFHSARNTR